MPERTAEKKGYTQNFDGYTFNLERASLYLLSIILADKELKQLYAKYDLSHMEPFLEDIKETEILHLLVEIATHYRLMEWNVRKDWKSKRYKTEYVGSLEIENRKVEIDLSMKEACNKIIHANKIDFDVSKLRGKPYHYFNPFIYVYGQKGKQKWKANIDLVLFCNAANQELESIFD